MNGAADVDRGFRAINRLSETDDFSSVFAFKRSLREGCLQLSYRPNGVMLPRLGLVVPKRLARRAVERNLVKRLGREAFRHAKASLPACDMVLRLVQPLDRRDRRELRQRLDALLLRLPR